MRYLTTFYLNLIHFSDYISHTDTHILTHSYTDRYMRFYFYFFSVYAIEATCHAPRREGESENDRGVSDKKELQDIRIVERALYVLRVNKTELENEISNNR